MTTFSIIIPVKRGGHVAAIDSIRRISADLSSYEIIVAEGSAPSKQRNLAAFAASGDILYFLDDDSLLNPDNLHICSEIMNDTNVAVVGGPSLTPASDSWLQQLFGCALRSVLGSGAVKNRYRASGSIRKTTEKELILCNLAIRRSVFADLGGFDERLYPNEENELLDRIRSSGHSLVHDPAMSVYRSQRSSLKAFIRQMFSYGRGRAQQSLISGSYSFVSFVPLFFVFYILLCSFLNTNALLMIPLLVYLVLITSFSLVEFFKSGHLYMLLLLFIFPLMHCVNGIGLLYGLVGGKPSPVCDNNIMIKPLKAFGQSIPES